MFLSLDGIDGTGKSTQARALAEWLRSLGRAVTECVDPGGTPVGQVIRALILDNKDDIAPACEALLFMSSRAQLVADVIRPALDRGDIVVSDRYVLSTLAYQGHAGGLDVAQLREAGKLATCGLMPDLTLLLDIPIEVAAQRRQGRAADRVERRPPAYHERVRQGFLAEARRDPSIVVLDATGDAETVQAAIRRAVEERFHGLGSGAGA
ncbi:MAG: dTMP kinase [Gemmataceae bacterium]|nr:dTMP kinase [Gemmataceae bacterium]